MVADTLPEKLVVGLTGGIGSGKSAASSFFSELGVDIVDADIVAREVVQPGSSALRSIAEHFGQSMLLEDGSLDRKKLRGRIFSSVEEKHWLETLLHPLIRQEIQHQLEACTSSYVILSSPLLIETGQHQLTDRILVIDAPEQQQIDRTRVRDNTTKDEVAAIMASQLSRAERLQAANDIIVNDSDLATLKTQVHKQHQFYQELTGTQACKKES